uniref:Uncharacterized protein n=1 Tax=Globodera rostochiensis TaxID=31243 RepID=A0A914GWE7_GLORO
MGFTKSDQIHNHSPTFGDRVCELHVHNRAKSSSSDRSRLSRLGAYLFGTCIWAEKASEWHQPPYHPRRFRNVRVLFSCKSMNRKKRDSSANPKCSGVQLQRHFTTVAVCDLSTKCNSPNSPSAIKAINLKSNWLVSLVERFRSRRKGADLAGGRELAQRAGPGNNGNGVCPAPDNANGPSACTSAGQQQQPSKRTVLISFSQTGSAQCTRKTVQSVDTCVADSFDDQMVDKMCSLPKGLDRHEWLASHVLALFEHVNCLSSTLSEVCTPVTCSTMSYPGNSKAQWVDERGKRHNYSAMRYIDSVMALCEGSRKNQSLFPTKYGASFAAEFEQYCARMVRLLWHCAGHAYAKHWEHLTALNLRLQFGLVLAHMAKLAKLYSLMSDKELSPLMHTLQLARPSTTTMTTASASDSCEAAVRALDDSTLTTTAGTTTASNGSSTALQGRAIQQQKKAHKREAKEDCKQAQHHPQHCTLKSGSWGGHSASTVALTVAPAAAVADYGSELVKKNCQQQQQKCCCAQTC